MHPDERFHRRKALAAVAVFLSILVFPMLGVPLLGEEADEQILPVELVSELHADCDVDKIYEKAWVQTLQALSPDEVDTFDFDGLGAAVMQILADCFEKELKEFDWPGELACEEMTCADLDRGIKRLKDLYAKYFRFFEDERFNGIDTSALYPSVGVPTWDKYQERLAACYRSVILSCACKAPVQIHRTDREIQEDCECDLERLLALWVDLVLDEGNPLADRIELADEVLAEYEECLADKIATMTDVEAMLDLILERDEETWFRYLGARGDTPYNNYTVACAVLKRLVELFNMNEDDVERYLCSPCCDTVWLLQQMAQSMRLHYIWKCPETGWREGVGCDPSGVWAFRQAFELSGGLYQFCRNHQLDKLAADCDPNAFCRILACREHGVAAYRETLEAQLADPREKEFLEDFEARLEECFGEDVELEHVIEWCVAVPASKTWEALRQLVKDKPATGISVQMGPAGPTTTAETKPSGSPQETQTTTAPSDVSIPQEIADFVRLLAWKGGQLGRIDPSQRWGASEDDPGEYCEPCGHTPMCVVCMEWDLQQWQTHRAKSVMDLVALMAVLSYLSQVSDTVAYQAAAAIYWDTHWDGWNNRDRPW